MDVLSEDARALMNPLLPGHACFLRHAGSLKLAEYEEVGRDVWRWQWANRTAPGSASSIRVACRRSAVGLYLGAPDVALWEGRRYDVADPGRDFWLIYAVLRSAPLVAQPRDRWELDLEVLTGRQGDVGEPTLLHLGDRRWRFDPSGRCTVGLGQRLCMRSLGQQPGEEWGLVTGMRPGDEIVWLTDQVISSGVVRGVELVR